MGPNAQHYKPMDTSRILTQSTNNTGDNNKTVAAEDRDNYKMSESDAGVKSNSMSSIIRQ